MYTIHSEKNSKSSSFPSYGIYGIFKRCTSKLIGYMTMGMSRTYRRVHQGSNTWDVFVIEVDDEYNVVLNESNILKWNKSVKNIYELSRRNGESTYLHILDESLEEVDFYMKPALRFNYQNEANVFRIFTDLCIKYNWCKFNLPNFDWSNEIHLTESHMPLFRNGIRFEFESIWAIDPSENSGYRFKFKGNLPDNIAPFIYNGNIPMFNINEEHVECNFAVMGDASDTEVTYIDFYKSNKYLDLHTDSNALILTLKENIIKEDEEPISYEEAPHEETPCEDDKHRRPRKRIRSLRD